MNEMELQEPRARRLLACLGVASRFRLVRALAQADRCVGELAVAVGLSQSCTTRHLQTLEREGLVKGRREGKRVRFRLRADAPGLGELLGWALSGVGTLEAAAGNGETPNDRSKAGPQRGRRGSEGRRRTRPESALAMRDGDRPPDRSVQGTGRGLESKELTADAAAEREGGAVAGSSVPTHRPGDLEDYLL